MNSTQQANNNHKRAIRKIAMWLGPRVTEKYELGLQKLKIASIFNSTKFLQLKTTQLFKRLNKLYYIKLRQNFYTINENLLMGEVNNVQKSIELTKVKDRVYEAKVKSLRVLSRQWKEKKSQNMYKNKYFTPKAEQTPKMQKQKVVQQVYIILRTFLRNKYLQAFNIIKRTQVTRSIKSKISYFFNYLAQKRRYWLIHGMQKMKLSMLVNRQQKHNEEILQLDTKLAPVSDPQLESLKQKQQKLQSTLQTVYRQKQAITKQVDDQIAGIEKSLEQKRAEIKQINQQKDKLSLQLQQLKKKQQKFTFSRQEIFYLIYERLLVNVKLWMQARVIDDGVRVEKGDLLSWLTVPELGFNLDMIGLKDEKQMNNIVITLTQLIKQYEKVIKLTNSNASNKKVDYSQIFHRFFFTQIPHITQSYQQILIETKFMHKMIQQIVKQNSILMVEMLEQIRRKHNKVIQESLEILEG